MPKLGLIMTEAVLTRWFVEDGKWVEKGQPLFSFESEKSEIEIESPASGFARLLVSAGTNVKVNLPVAEINKEAGAESSHPEVPQPSKEEAEQAAISKPADGAEKIITSQSVGLRATPKARVLAREKSIPLEGLSGSGPRGMLVTADVLAATAQAGTVRATPLARNMARAEGLDLREINGSGPAGRITRQDVQHALAGAGSTAGGVQAAPLTGLRAVIAERLTSGWNERPQVTLVTEVDATNLVAAREQMSAELGRKISFNAFFVLAAAKALGEYPMLNAQLTSQGMLQPDGVHIGIAVDTERGLLVPVMKDAEALSLVQASDILTDLAKRAQAGKCTLDELSGGTFSITNLGAFGIDAFTPIINPPEAAILGIGRIAPRPFVVERQLTVRDTVTLSLSFDHRLVDGAPAARFLQRIAQLIERPLALVAGHFN
jgi:pyruvate dehydrogenase E2 component (dihydrolipoamide acetyltransferase)